MKTCEAAAVEPVLQGRARRILVARRRGSRAAASEVEREDGAIRERVAESQRETAALRAIARVRRAGVGMREAVAQGDAEPRGGDAVGESRREHAAEPDTGF